MYKLIHFESINYGAIPKQRKVSVTFRNPCVGIEIKGIVSQEHFENLDLKTLKSLKEVITILELRNESNK